MALVSRGYVNLVGVDTHCKKVMELVCWLPYRGIDCQKGDLEWESIY